MPLYHFHVHDSVDIPDSDGTILPSLSEARSEAFMLAGRIVIDAGLRRDPGDAWNVTVTDEFDMILFRMDFILTESAAVGKRPKSETRP